MQVLNEVREATVELNAREVSVDHIILAREVPTDAESGTNLHILAREHKSFEEYVQEVRASSFPIACIRV